MCTEEGSVPRPPAAPQHGVPVRQRAIVQADSRGLHIEMRQVYPHTKGVTNWTARVENDGTTLSRGKWSGRRNTAGLSPRQSPLVHRAAPRLPPATEALTLPRRPSKFVGFM